MPSTALSIDLMDPAAAPPAKDPWGILAVAPLTVHLKDTAASLAEDPAELLEVAPSTALSIDLKDTAAAPPAKDPAGFLCCYYHTTVRDFSSTKFFQDETLGLCQNSGLTMAR